MSPLASLACIAIWIVSTVNARSSNDNLVAVAQLFRHGERTPAAFYANDPYQNKSSWDGLDVGQLTNEGKRQHYALGKYTRSRYQGWLPSRYDKDIFYGQTTDVDRTHMSGQANLNGLYPARFDQIWRRFSNWQPIPLHPASDAFSAYPTTCAAYFTELANVIAGDEIAQINNKYAELFSFLTEKSGSNITSVTNAGTIFDCFKIESGVGYRLPEWASQVYPQPLYDLYGITFQLYSYTTKLQRLVVGPFLNEIIEYFEEAANNTSSYKFKMYSAHDLNIANVLNALGAYNSPYPPEFASTIYFELRQSQGEYYINVWSQDGLDSKIIPVSIRGCALDCPLSEVKERLSEIVIDLDTFNAECLLTERSLAPESDNYHEAVEQLKMLYDN